MIYAYGITLQGTYHVKMGTVCQDSHCIIKCGDDMVIAAVADGLGSEAYSDVASALAVETSTYYCKESISRENTPDEILATIKASFVAAQQAIEKQAQLQENDLNQYDTTLSLAVLLHDKLYYGHSGDSGIVVLTDEGLYEKVTEQQRDENGYVFPLCFQDYWVFGQYEKRVSSTFLATDGMFDTLFPYLIKNERINIHINLARFFMDNRSLCIDQEGEAAVQRRIESFISDIPDEQVSDDKTIVVLVNPAVESQVQPEAYYQEPNWVELKRKHEEEWKRLAYPKLFGEAQGVADPDESVTTIAPSVADSGNSLSEDRPENASDNDYTQENGVE